MCFQNVLSLVLQWLSYWIFAPRLRRIYWDEFDNSCIIRQTLNNKNGVFNFGYLYQITPSTTANFKTSINHNVLKITSLNTSTIYYTNTCKTRFYE